MENNPMKGQNFYNHQRQFDHLRGVFEERVTVGWRALGNLVYIFLKSI
jgi:hypothetical protein